MLIGKQYLPILKVKLSEIEAFRQMSTSCKDVTFPIFILLPWPNANSLRLSIDKIIEATGGRSFGLGLDDDRFGGPSGKAAQADFDKLFNPSNGFKAYYDFIFSIDGAIPVIQNSNKNSDILSQLSNVERVDRGFIIHQKRGDSSTALDLILTGEDLPDDVLFVVDSAWSRDVLEMQSWAISVVRKILNTAPDAEIAIVSSSFPDSFSHIVGESEEVAFETHVYNVIRTTFQRADLTYGDWGSTRLSQGGGGGKIPSRIDIPRSSSWQIFRADPKADFGFGPIATQAMLHFAFAQLPNCWGKLQIAATDGAKSGITGTKKNTSARINMHMTIQAGAESTIDFDEEPYQD